MTASENTPESATSATSDTAGSSRLQLLSNGRYHVMVTDEGGGYSGWKGLALTRWREDATGDSCGAFCYISDVDGGHVWSTTRQPTLPRARVFSASFSPGLAMFRVRAHDIEVQTEVVVSAVDDVELRRVRVTDHSVTRRTLALTSYAELVLGTAAADAAHPAFETLFVETEVLRELQAIVCTRRARS